MLRKGGDCSFSRDEAGTAALILDSSVGPSLDEERVRQEGLTARVWCSIVRPCRGSPCFDQSMIPLNKESSPVKKVERESAGIPGPDEIFDECWAF
jgi:hypothetical protein